MLHEQSQTSEDPVSSTTADFSLIKGIGPAIQTRLHEAGILTFAQLSVASPKEIAAVTGLSAKRIAKEDWAGQAFGLAEQPASRQTQTGEVYSQTLQHCATFTVELLLDEDNNVRRTRVIHDQDRMEETWSGWVEPRLVNFFVRYARLHRPLPEPGSLPGAISPVETTVFSEAILPPGRASESQSLERLPHWKPKPVLNGVLKVSELTTTKLDSNVPQYVAHANEAFNAHLLLDLSEVKTLPVRSVDCQVTIWAKELGTGAHQIVGQGRSTFKPVAEVSCVVESRIPSQGSYRLEAVVTLTPAATIPSPHSTLMAWVESGLLQVY